VYIPHKILLYKAIISFPSITKEFPPPYCALCHLRAGVTPVLDGPSFHARMCFTL
jgi:hypothetical protein